jgi:hexosaminidase
MIAIAIIPRPVSMIQHEGAFVMNSKTVIFAEKAFQKQVSQTKLLLNLDLKSSSKMRENAISFRFQSGLGAEGYSLVVTKTGVEVKASNPAGAFYGIQTLKQLMPVAVYGTDGQIANNDSEWSVPFVEIVDQPRFSWRGSHLDVARHIMPLEWIKKYIDLLAMHKMNTFHWHLTEDQGWRIEIKKYPKLTSVGAFRKSSPLGHDKDKKQDGIPYGGFYTQAQAREIVKYAAERFINVVPEIEMPGHAQAAIAAYPELGNTTEKVEVGTQWGVINRVYNVEDSTIQFQKDVLTEIMAIFPSKFIHIGGDECPKGEWEKSPRVQELMKLRGIKNEHEMQSWFIRQIDGFLASKGRRLIGWDEILEGGLAPGAAVMSWRGDAGGVEAANAGHDVVMASYNALYFDYYQADPKSEPLAIGGLLPLDKVYAYDLLPKGLAADKQKHIIGGQYQLWTEYMKTSDYVEYMAFPRACAAAEIFWSPLEGKDFANFSERLKVHGQRLDRLGVNRRK